MAALTKWEKDHLAGLQRVIEIVYKHEEEILSVPITADSWILFRYIVMDLYSLLDHAWYFLYCHFRVKIVKDDPQSGHDGRRKFVDTKSELILKKSIANIWFANVIGEIVLEPQPKCDTNISGQSTDALLQPNSSEESLTLLHYYRNYVTHRELVHIERATMHVEVNRTTRETKIVELPGNDIECIYLPIQEGDWIKVPKDLVRAGGDNSYRTLKEVLSQLRRFVMGMVTKLLYAALIFSDGDEGDEGAEDKWCTTELKSLLLKHMQGVVQPLELPLPIVKIGLDDRKNFQQMINELKQQMTNAVKEFICEWSPDDDGRTSRLQFSCGQFQEEFSSKGTSQKAKELAAKNAIHHFHRLGLVKFTSAAPVASNTLNSRLENPLVMLHKSQQQTYTQLLNELIDKNCSQTFDIKKESETIVLDQKEVQVYHCTIILTLTEMNGKQNKYQVTCSGKGKQKAKEAASENILSQLSSWVRVNLI
ncbi:hypothetical protein EMCRGX_G006386 [Ephydatia muelleri]